MSLRRVCTVATRVLVLGLAVLIVPACKKKEDTAPHITNNFTPLFDAGSVPQFPLMVLEFDRALDPATVTNANIVLYLTDPITGIHTTPFGGGTTVKYLDGSFQVIITNNAAFATSKEYAVVIFPELTSDVGTPIGALPTGSIALRFTTAAADHPERPTFTNPVKVAGGGPGEIVWQWSSAQEGAPLADIGATYDLFRATATDGQDLFGTKTSPGTPPPNFTTTGLTPGATYFFRMIVTDNFGNVTITSEFSAAANGP